MLKKRRYAKLPLTVVNWSKRAKRTPGAAVVKRSARNKYFPGWKGSVPRSLWYYTCCPFTMNIKEKTTKLYSLTTGNPGFTVVKFYVNSYYDPFGTGGTEKGYMHDIWANVYHHYAVTKAQVTCELINNQADQILHVVLVPVGYSDFDTTNAAAGARGSRQMLMNEPLTKTDQRTISTPVIPVQNIRFRSLEDKEMSADFGANPAALTDVHLYVQPYVPADISVSCRITVTQWIVLSRPMDIEEEKQE